MPTLGLLITQHPEIGPMADAADLIPPLAVINERLSKNQRERNVLRQLQRLAFREETASHSHADLKRPNRTLDERVGA
jgi:hypothetical protein